jgi:TonB family protein
MWLALARQFQKDSDNAEKLFQSALSKQDPSSLDAAATMTLYAELLKQENRTDEANQMNSRAASIRAQRGAEASRTVTRSPGVLRIGPGITPPGVLEKVEPKYSDEARASRFQGTVVLQAEIGTDGLAHNLAIQRPLGLGLDEKALDAVSQWHFRPATKDGEPVPVIATVEINFRLL